MRYGKDALTGRSAWRRSDRKIEEALSLKARNQQALRGWLGKLERRGGRSLATQTVLPPPIDDAEATLTEST
jgi:hypothetical protein